MSNSASTPLVWLAVLVVLAVIGYFVFRALRKRRVERTGAVVIGTVVSVDMTHTQINHQPVMKITFDYPEPGGGTHRAHLRTQIPPGSSIDAGDRFALTVDPKDPELIYLANNAARRRGQASGALSPQPGPGSSGVQVSVNGVSVDLNAAQRTVKTALGSYPKGMQDMMQRAMARQQEAVALGGQAGPMAVGDVTAIRAQDRGITSVQVDVVRIGKPRETVFCTQPFPEGIYFEVGDRVFLRLDGNDPPHAGFIEPLSFSNGEPIPRTGNRTDALVLADDLLFAGSKAQGTILSVTGQPLPAAYTKTGASKWQLHVHVVPADGTPPYDGDCSVAVTNPQKADSVNKAGLALPLRYDPADPPTFTIDSIALGWGDPRLAREAAGKIALESNYGINS